MNESGVIRETETIYRRLAEPLILSGREINPQWWLAIVLPVLLLGIFFVIWMYIRDCRSIRWYFAIPMAVCRIGVYLLLVYMFLLPSKQTWERSEKRSRVLVILDISNSFKQADDPLKPKETRVRKVIDFLSDENVAFMRNLMEKNPIYLYRMGARLDDSPQVFEKRTNKDDITESEKTEFLPLNRIAVAADGTQQREYGNAWTQDDWTNFAEFDFKPWILRNISSEGRKKITAVASFAADTTGNAEWAGKWIKEKDEDVYPEGLSTEDKTALKNSRDNLPKRIDLITTIAEGTDVPESTLTAISREAGNMVQGIVIFSDGRNTIGSDSAVSELRSRAKKENVPIFTVVVGEDRPKIAIRITDISAPEQTTPNEPFKVIIEVDGDGLVNQELPVTLDLYPPKRDTPYSITKIKVKDPTTNQKIERELKVKILPNGDAPPHGQLEIVIDPEDLPDELKSKESDGKELINGDWKINARINRAKDEPFPDKEHKGKPADVKIKKQSLRVLLFASGASRDFQFLLTQMIRDKAELSVFLQNQAGKDQKLALLDDPKRILDRFPDRLVSGAVEKEDEAPYNLANYDVIVTFDADWTELNREQVQNLQKWVEFQGGGIIFVAGPLHTKKLARVDNTSDLGPLLEMLPVYVGDIDLANIRRSTRDPWRIRFTRNIGPEDEYLRLDEEKAGDITSGWEPFFSGKDTAPEGVKPLRGFFSYYPVLKVKDAAKTIATFTDPDAHMPENRSEESPWLVSMKARQGTTMFVGSGEIWRLRQFREVYFERFWTKLIRHVGSGSLYKPGNTGRLLMSKEITSGNYLRVNAQMFDSSYTPLPPNTSPKVTMIPVTLREYQTKDTEKENLKYRRTLELKGKKGPEEWSGVFSGQVLASAATFPPGLWKIEVEAPGAPKPVRGEMTIKPSDPETDNIRPDYQAMAQIAGEFEELTQVKDTGAIETLRTAAREIDSQKLAFRFDNRTALEAIPKCLDSQTRTQRNKGAVEDLWDRGIELPKWLTSWLDASKTYHIAWTMLLAITLLSIEWACRKLLRLA